MRGFVVICALFFSLGIHAHEYYFAFAEIKVNTFSQRMEGTIMCTEHDLELGLKDEGVMVKELSISLEDSTIYAFLENYINNHFQIKTNNFKSNFRLVGYESFLNGQIYLYIESNPLPDEYESLDVRFDLLMDIFNDQQNKLTIYHEGTSTTTPFIRGDASQIIEIKNG